MAVQRDVRVQAGDHWCWRRSRQISPVYEQREEKREWGKCWWEGSERTLKCTLGCQMRVLKDILGGLVGYVLGIWMESSNSPPYQCPFLPISTVLLRANLKSGKLTCITPRTRSPDLGIPLVQIFRICIPRPELQQVFLCLPFALSRAICRTIASTKQYSLPFFHQPFRRCLRWSGGEG